MNCAWCRWLMWGSSLTSVPILWASFRAISLWIPGARSMRTPSTADTLRATMRAGGRAEALTKGIDKAGSSPRAASR
jgi:hypothetical protein